MKKKLLIVFVLCSSFCFSQENQDWEEIRYNLNYLNRSKAFFKWVTRGYANNMAEAILVDSLEFQKYENPGTAKLVLYTGNSDPGNPFQEEHILLKELDSLKLEDYYIQLFTGTDSTDVSILGIRLMRFKMFEDSLHLLESVVQKLEEIISFYNEEE